MTITIVCPCGQHNAVHDSELDVARCALCHSMLLKPSIPAVATERQIVMR